MADLFNSDGAEFSNCSQYRYALWRFWDQDKPVVTFIGLNPSTANATTDDPTIRSCKRIAAGNGFGGMYMCNLFGYISTDPTMLLKETHPIGQHNDAWLHSCTAKAHSVVFCWGNLIRADHPRITEVMQRYPQAVNLGVNNNGTPKHPLYLKSDTQLQVYVHK